MKRCDECFTEKQLSEFNENTKNLKDGKQNKCRECQSAFFKAWAARRSQLQQQVVVDAKVCRDCGLEKPINQFGKKSTSLDKHNIYCKPCWQRICKKAKMTAYRKSLDND